MEIENFQLEYPQLATQLLEGEKCRTKKANKIEDKYYVYIKSRKSKYVYRCCKLDGSWMYSFHGLGEKRTFLDFMRECPNCGHRDNPLWENSRFEFNAEFMRFQEAQQQHELENVCLVLDDAPNHEPFMHDGVVYYRRGKDGIELYRQNPEDFRVPRERKNHGVKV